MDSLNSFTIPHKGLKEGVHNYEFNLNESFFAEFEDSPINVSDVKVDLVLDKRSNMLVLDFEISGTMNNPCDRCLNKINIPLIGNSEIMVKYSDDAQNTDEVIYISDKDSSIDVSSLIYEFCVLAMPMTNKVDCEAQGYEFCNNEILDRLEVEQEEEEPDSEVNIWDALKDLDLNNN